jgi:hypothetical protein
MTGKRGSEEVDIKAIEIQTQVLRQMMTQTRKTADTMENLVKTFIEAPDRRLDYVENRKRFYDFIKHTKHTSELIQRSLNLSSSSASSPALLSSSSGTAVPKPRNIPSTTSDKCQVVFVPFPSNTVPLAPPNM